MPQIHAIRRELLQHPMYRALNTPGRLRIFMQHHVFAVWDFMSLLKRLQQDLTCVSVPWVPRKGGHYVRFINEIVLGEESDADGRGGYASHLELYLEAMAECGADTGPITRFLSEVAGGRDPLSVLESLPVPGSVARFVGQTLDTARRAATHEVCAAFFFGREEIIPDMFQSLVKELQAAGFRADRLLYYLHRHIELDAGEHGPLAERLLVHLCGEDPGRLAEAEAAARTSLHARIRLWDGVLAAIAGAG